ncbi:MAG: AMP-binding protein, partial [Coriobacteriales bacterium]|nr:AMP-binding protein [Coriobacteriales bacterium]
MRNIHKRYARESYDENGIIREFSLVFPEDFNFAYDIVDDIATAEPNRPAMVWCNPEGEEHLLSFGDMKLWSDKTANFLASQGIGRGDLVLVILRRHYQFWFTALALNKLGAILVPATFMLKEHDLKYRVNSAGIKALICTNVGEIAQIVDSALPQCPTLTTRILVNGGGANPAMPKASSFNGEKNGPVCPSQLSQTTCSGEAADGRAVNTLSGPGGLCALGVEREGWLDFNTAVAVASPVFEKRATKAADPMIMYFSSGTSGNPKMVLHNS